MYFIIEHIDQLNKLSPSESGFIQVISNNDNYHPKLAKASLIYYNNFSKGYIFSIDHSESMSLDINNVIDFLKLHKKLYLFDKKYHSYFIDISNTIDLQIVAVNQFGKFDQSDCDTILHNDFNNRLSQEQEVNRLIPISKHYEKCECFYDKVNHLMGLETNSEMEDLIADSYKYVEEQGILVDKSKFEKYYKIPNPSYSVKNGIMYGYYNLYNTTGRPTNAFNGVNFLAIPKDDGSRESFLPKNDVFVEFDFDAYHLRLIAKLVDYECPDGSMHEYLGKKYFGKDQLSEDEYKKSKEISFRQLYGGIEDQYKDIEFFSKLDTYIEKEWKKYNTFGAAVLPTGRTIKKAEGMNKLRVFNYIIQNTETATNVEKIQQIKSLLKNKKSQIVLITYDSFLFDYSISDGKDTLESIRELLESGGFKVKHKYGKNYQL